MEVVAAHGVSRTLRRPFTWLREHPDAADALLALVVAAISLPLHLTSATSGGRDAARDPTWWTTLLVLVSTLPIAARRRRPVETLAVVLVAQSVSELAGVVGSGWVGVLVAVYTVGAHTEGRRQAEIALSTLAALIAVFVVGLSADELTVADGIASTGTFVAAFALGDNLRRRRANLAALHERADRAERERDLLARERVTEERTRIARELHDIVAHSVTGMIIQAAAARRQMATHPAEAAAVLEDLERCGRTTMDELRQVLGVLRDPSAEALDVPVPTLAELPALVDAASVPVELTVAGDVEAVPAGIGVSVYRIVQEALTNVARHAGPGVRTTVRVTCSPTEVVVLVDDDGRGASATASSSQGYGLVGMRERASATGGTLIAGPRTGGGWRVAATIPLHHAPTELVS